MMTTTGDVTATAGAPEGPAPGAAQRSRRPGAPTWAYGLLGLALFAALLEVVPRLGLVPARYLPPMSGIVSALAGEAGGGTLWTAVGETMKAWAIGLGISVVAAVVIGVIIGSVPFLLAVTSSTIEFLRPIPSVALIPLAVLMFGTGLESTLLLVVYASFWQVLIQVLYGVQDVDPVAMDTARSYRLGRLGRIRHVIWPTALPYVVTGIRLAASVALVLAISGELIIGSPGLGHEISQAQSGGAVAVMYALVVVTGLIGVAINLVFRIVERRLLAWHTSVRGEAV